MLNSSGGGRKNSIALFPVPKLFPVSCPKKKFFYSAKALSGKSAIENFFNA